MLRLIETGALLCLGIGRKVVEDMKDWFDYFVQQGKLERDRSLRNLKGMGFVTKSDIEALSRKIDALSAELQKSKASPPAGAVPPKGGKEHHH